MLEKTEAVKIFHFVIFRIKTSFFFFVHLTVLLKQQVDNIPALVPTYLLQRKHWKCGKKNSVNNPWSFNFGNVKEIDDTSFGPYSNAVGGGRASQHSCLVEK